MADKETRSLWSHLLGESVQGKLLGSKLKSIPSVITSWKDWKRLHAKTVVLSMPGRLKGQEYDQSFYRSNRGKQFVIGYAAGNSARHYSFETLKKQPLVNDTVESEPILLFFDKVTGAAWAFRRTVEDRVLTFATDGETIIDNDTNSIWDLRAGKSTSGKLAGKELVPVVVIPSYRSAWKNFHPDSKSFATSTDSQSKAE